MDPPTPTTAYSVDFDTAAYMLMADDDYINTLNSSNNTNTITNANTATNTNNYFTNPPNTPPQFDFDSIGQMLISPNTNNILNPSHEMLNHNTATASTDLLLNSLNSPIIPTYIQSPSYPNAALDPLLNLNSAFSSPKLPNHSSLGIVFQNPMRLTSNELLTNTESLALETFLDSIANESIAKQREKQKLQQEVDPIKEVPESELDSEQESEPTLTSKKGEEEQVDELPSKKQKLAKRSKPSTKKNVEILTKEDRQQIHKLTEQKRRDTIKDAYQNLYDLIDSSKFALDDTSEDTTPKVPKKKRKRDAQKSAKPMKKFEVLQKSIREIEFLLERNKSLTILLGE